LRISTSNLGAFSATSKTSPSEGVPRFSAEDRQRGAWAPRRLAHTRQLPDRQDGGSEAVARFEAGASICTSRKPVRHGATWLSGGWLHRSTRRLVLGLATARGALGRRSSCTLTSTARIPSQSSGRRLQMRFSPQSLEVESKFPATDISGDYA
jgi:hypothetical protein